MARLTPTRDGREAWAFTMTSQMPPPLQGPLRPLARLAVGSMVPDDPTDMLVTLDAEDVFDVETDLPRITAPTLVIGGAKYPFYSRELFVDTAAGVQDGRAHIFEDWGHLRTCRSGATTHLTLGFMLAGMPIRPEKRGR